MRLVIDVAYSKFLLPEGANTDAILQALAGAIPVEEKQEDYSKPKKYAIKRDGSGFESPVFVTDSQIIDEDEAAEMDIGKLRKENSRYIRERNAAQEKLKELESKVSTLTDDKTS